MKRDEINQDQNQIQNQESNNNRGHHRSSSSSSSSSDRGRISDLSYLYEVLGKSSFDEMVTTLSRFNQSSFSSSSSSSSSFNHVNKTPPTLSSSFIQYNGFPPSLNFHQLSQTQYSQEQDESSSKPNKPRSRSRRSSMSGYTNIYSIFIIQYLLINFIYLLGQVTLDTIMERRSSTRPSTLASIPLMEENEMVMEVFQEEEEEEEEKDIV